MKKTLMALGSLVAVVSPVAAVISCGDESSATTDNSVQVLSFTTSDNALPAARANSATQSDIGRINVSNIISDATEVKSAKDKFKNSTNGKIQLAIAFADSTVDVDVQVKLNGNNPVVTVNKVYLKPKTGTFTLKEAGSNVALFKKHVKSLVVAFAKNASSTLTGIALQREIFATFGSQVGMSQFFAAANTNKPAEWEGTWVAQETYDRLAFMFKGEAVEELGITDLTNTAAMDAVETALKAYAITLKSDAKFGSWATQEETLQHQTNPQSSITFGAFTSKGQTSDDMVVFAINNLSKENVNAFIVKAANESTQLSALTGANLKLWNKIKLFSVAQ